MSSTFGTLFRATTFGESHGIAVGVVIDGCPPGVEIDPAAIQLQLDRRRPGQSRLVTPRDEQDRVRILSGVEDGLSLGTPIAMAVNNRDIRPADYSQIRSIPRPSHADYTYRVKYGKAASSGGGRASARETIGRVAAGAVAEQFLSAAYGIQIVAWVSSVGRINAPDVLPDQVIRPDIDASDIRCPDPVAARAMEAAILTAKEENDSLGGIVSCICRHVPAGLGEPVFDKAEALLAHAMLSIPASKGFELGSGFAGTRMQGSAHNDPFVQKDGRLGTLTNNSGGVQGGITNGEPVLFQVAFKPVATIGKPQKTVDFEGNEVQFEAKGRHDPCVVPRAVPIVEGMAALVLADLALRQQSRTGRL